MTIDVRQSYTLPTGYTFLGLKQLYTRFQQEGDTLEGSIDAMNDIMRAFNSLERASYRFSEPYACVFLYNAASQLVFERSQDRGYVVTMLTFRNRLFETPYRYEHDLHEIYDELLRCKCEGYSPSHMYQLDCFIRALQTGDEYGVGVFTVRFNKHSSVNVFRNMVLQHTDQLMFAHRPIDENEKDRLDACLLALDMLLPHQF